MKNYDSKLLYQFIVEIDKRNLLLYILTGPYHTDKRLMDVKFIQSFDIDWTKNLFLSDKFVI